MNMDYFARLLKKEEEIKQENKALKVVLWVFLVVGIVAGLAVIAKVLYDKYKKDMDCFDDECCLDDLLDDCDDCECECVCDCECTEEEAAPCECACECSCETEEAPAEA